MAEKLPPDDNIVLEYLRAIRGEVRDIRATQLEMMQRIGNLEQLYANLESQYANLSNRVDRIELKIDRIEARLGLTDAPQPGQ